MIFRTDYATYYDLPNPKYLLTMLQGYYYYYYYYIITITITMLILLLLSAPGGQASRTQGTRLRRAAGELAALGYPRGTPTLTSTLRLP